MMKQPVEKTLERFAENHRTATTDRERIKTDETAYDFLSTVFGKRQEVIEALYKHYQGLR